VLSADRSTAQAVAVRNLAIDVVTREVVQAFEEAGIPVILLKGPTISKWLYTDGAPRPYGDSDLLVDPADFTRAGRVLVGLGFTNTWAAVRRSERDSHSDGFVRTELHGRFTVDLHHRLEWTKLEPAAVWATLLSRAETIQLAGTAITCLDEAGRCMLLSLHAAQHGYASQKPLEDLRRGRLHASAAAWSEAEALARRLGASTAYAMGLALTQETPESLVRTSLWREAETNLRAFALGLLPSSRDLLRMRDLPRHRRPGYALARLFASPAILRIRQRRDAGLATLYARHFRDLLQQFPKGIRQARDVHRVSHASAAASDRDCHTDPCSR
jgi:hypothetical protein